MIIMMPVVSELAPRRASLPGTAAAVAGVVRGVSEALRGGPVRSRDSAGRTDTIRAQSDNEDEGWSGSQSLDVDELSPGLRITGRLQCKRQSVYTGFRSVPKSVTLNDLERLGWHNGLYD